jgi:hypothetical protein
MSAIVSYPGNRPDTLKRQASDTSRYSETTCTQCGGSRRDHTQLTCIYCGGDGTRAAEIRIDLADLVAEALDAATGIDISWHRAARAIITALEANGLDVLTMRTSPLPLVERSVHLRLVRIAGVIAATHPAEASQLDRLSLDVKRLETWADDVVAEAAADARKERL